jgi:hypothetical protein
MSEYNTMDPEKIKAKFDVKMTPYPHSEAGVEVCYVSSSCAVLCFLWWFVGVVDTSVTLNCTLRSRIAE